MRVKNAWRLRDTLRPIGAIALAGVGIVTNVTPIQAQSNVSAWLSIVFGDVPDWLKAVQVDTWVQAIAFAGAMALVIAMSWSLIASTWQRVRTKRAAVVEPQLPIPTQPTFVLITEVARELYGRARGTGLGRRIEGYATMDGKLDTDAVLSICAMHVASTAAAIYGKHPPSIAWETMPKTLLNEGTFRGDAFHRYGEKSPLFVDVSIMATERVDVIEELVADEEMQVGFEQVRKA